MLWIQSSVHVMIRRALLYDLSSAVLGQNYLA